MKLKIKIKERDMNKGGEMDRGQPDRYEACGMEEKKGPTPLKIKILSTDGEKLHGGAGDNKPDSAFDPKQLAIGIGDETGEHTPDKEIGKEIAKDHLSQDPDYYKKLKAAGIDEQLKIMEQEKKVAVLMSELLKQLEIHKDKIWVFFDTETTGMDPNVRQLTEIAGISVRPSFLGGNAQILNQYHKKIELTPETQKQLNEPFVSKHPSEKPVKDILQMTQYFSSAGEKVDEQQALAGFNSFIKEQEKLGEVLLVAHNAKFDRKFVSVRSSKYGLETLDNKTLDTVQLAYELYYPLLSVVDEQGLLKILRTAKGFPSFTVGTLTKALNIDNKDWHTAISDVKVLIEITQKIINHLMQKKDVDVRKGYDKAMALRRKMSSWGKGKK